MCRPETAAKGRGDVVAAPRRAPRLGVTGASSLDGVGERGKRTTCTQAASPNTRPASSRATVGPPEDGARWKSGFPALQLPAAWAPDPVIDGRDRRKRRPRPRPSPHRPPAAAGHASLSPEAALGGQPFPMFYFGKSEPRVSPELATAASRSFGTFRGHANPWCPPDSLLPRIRKQSGGGRNPDPTGPLMLPQAGRQGCDC